MTEHLPEPHQSPERKLSDADKSELIRQALEEARQRRADDERRGAGYLNTGAHAQPEKFLQPIPASGEVVDEDVPSETSGDSGLPLYKQAELARKRGDTDALDRLQGQADRWAADGLNQGRRRVNIDVTQAPEDVSGTEHPTVDWRAAKVDLDQLLKEREIDAGRKSKEKTDFTEWEREFTERPETVPKITDAAIAELLAESAAEATHELPSDHQTIDTPKGPVEIDYTKVDDEVEVEVANTADEMIVKDTIRDRETGEEHTIETVVSGDDEQETELLLDGEPVAPEYAEQVAAAIEHVNETISEAVEQKKSVEKSLDQKARQFFTSMYTNPGVRQVMTQSFGELGISQEDFVKSLEKVTPDDLKKMTAIFKEAGPKSTIWNERPGNNLLGRAAKEQQDRLKQLITDITRR